MPKNFQSPSVCLETPRMSSPFVVMFILWMLIGEKSSKNSKIPWLLDWMLPNASLQTTICMPTSKLLFVKITKLWCKKTCSTDSNYDGYFLSCNLGIEFGAWFWQLILLFFQNKMEFNSQFRNWIWICTNKSCCLCFRQKQSDWLKKSWKFRIYFLKFDFGSYQVSKMIAILCLLILEYDW